MDFCTSVAEARPVTHCTRLASHTSPITLVMAISSSVGSVDGSPSAPSSLRYFQVMVNGSWRV